ncbi:hypothetical protein [Streptomyces sp. 2A115]|uniref:hypothetical protein n=1 Tax=Streptomyces sp. 2A115 TaxID=3457439 RepID=UPI003FD27948
MKFTQRAATLFAATTLAAGATLTGGASPASAATITFKGTDFSGDNYQIVVLRDGENIGYVYWNSDPEPGLGWPGDAMRVSDTDADGYGIEAHLSFGRIATTRGHAAPYTSPWATGDLTEGLIAGMKVCLVKGTYSNCSGWHNVKA